MYPQEPHFVKFVWSSLLYSKMQANN